MMKSLLLLGLMLTVLAGLTGCASDETATTTTTTEQTTVIHDRDPKAMR